MNTKRSAKRVLTPAAVIGLVVAGGFTISSAMAGDGSDHPAPGVATAPGGQPAPYGSADFPVNAQGDSYGPSENVAFEDWPDLILVEASNGADGYVERDLLNEVTGANVSSPEEAVAWQKQSDSEGWTVKELPVYESDGRTQVGVFVVSRSTTSESTER